MSTTATTNSRLFARDKASAETLSRSETAIILLFFSLIIVIMSVFVFSRQSLRLDEAQSLWQTTHSPAAIMEIVAQDVHVPLYHLMLHYWQYAFGNDVVTARMLSLIFLLLIIPSIYFLGKLASSKTVGLYAALLVTISPFLNWYGNEIRMYSLFTLLVILNQYFYIKIFKGERHIDSGDVSGKVWLGYIVTVVLGIFTHYFFILLLVTQAVFFAAFRNSFPKQALKTFVMVALLAFLVFTPWIYYVYQQGSASNTQPHLSQPTSIDIFNTFSQFLFGFQNDHINTIILSLWPLLVLLVFLSLRRNQGIAPESVYLFSSLFLPIILAYGISIGVKAIYVTRYLILAVPSLYILISWILTTYPKRLSRTIKAGLFAAMIVTLTIEIVSASTPVKECYREASQYLTEKASAQDIIVLSAPFTIYPFEYYYKGSASLATLPIWDRNIKGAIPAFSSDNLQTEVQTLKDSHQTLWLLLSYDQGYESDLKLYFDTHFEQIDHRAFSPGMNLYGYKLRYDNKSLTEVLRELNGNKLSTASKNKANSASANQNTSVSTPNLPKTNLAPQSSTTAEPNSDINVVILPNDSGNISIISTTTSTSSSSTNSEPGKSETSTDWIIHASSSVEYSTSSKGSDSDERTNRKATSSLRRNILRDN